MSTTLQDGTGSNIRAKVNASHELLTKAETLSEYEQGVADGRAFNINDNNKTVSAVTGEQAVLYVANNSLVDLNLKNLFGSIWDRTAGSKDTNIIRLLQNPTGGTLISDASSLVLPNRNFGSTNTFSDIVAYGATAGGKTLTGQNTTPTAFITHSNGRLFVGIDLVLPAGQSMGITMESYGGSFDYYIGFAGYKGKS